MNKRELRNLMTHAVTKNTKKNTFDDNAVVLFGILQVKVRTNIY